MINDKTKPIVIVTAFNQKYVRYAYVMMESVFINNENGTVLIYALHSGISGESKSLLESLAIKYQDEVCFIHITENMFPRELPSSEQWSIETYFRLFISDVIPKNVDRILYLDVDIIVNQSVKELFEIDMDGCIVAACEDVSGIPFGDARDVYFAEHLSQGYSYFCAGVTLFDMNAMRAKYHFNDYMKIAADLKYSMVAFDQDLLNLMHWQEVGYLDSNKWELFAKLAYNHDIHYEEVKDFVAIIHYTGEKPWEGQYIHYDIQKLWWDYARLSPFYHEFLQEFVYQSINNPFIYNAFSNSLKEKQELQKKIDVSTEICKKAVALFA